MITSHIQGSITFEDVEAIMEYVDKKLTDGLPRADLAKRLKSPVQRTSCVLSAKKGTKSSGVKEKDEDISQLVGQGARVLTGNLRSPSMRAMTTSDITQTPSKASIVTTSSMVNTSNDQWENFADEFESYDICLNENDRRKWQATLNVKIEMAKNLDKSINSYTGSKKFPKYGSKDVFEKWSRNLTTELNTIPLCAGRLESGALENPRVEPNSEFIIFIDENDEFDTSLFQSAIMLYNMLGMLRDKITKFLYSTLVYCVNENETAQEVLRATPQNFMLLYARLSERFQKNTDVKKKRLLQDFENLK